MQAEPADVVFMKLSERRALDELLEVAAAEAKVEKMTIKRAEARHKVILQVEMKIEVQVRSSEEEEKIISGRTYDVSSQGVGIQAREPISAGTDVGVRQPFVERPRWISGAVRHCTTTLNGYKIGIRFNVD